MRDGDGDVLRLCEDLVETAARLRTRMPKDLLDGLRRSLQAVEFYLGHPGLPRDAMSEALRWTLKGDVDCALMEIGDRA